VVLHHAGVVRLVVLRPAPDRLRNEPARLPVRAVADRVGDDFEVRQQVRHRKIRIVPAAGDVQLLVRKIRRLEPRQIDGRDGIERLRERDRRGENQQRRSGLNDVSRHARR
jgi:hypothetical protein